MALAFKQRQQKVLPFLVVLCLAMALQSLSKITAAQTMQFSWGWAPSSVLYWLHWYTDISIRCSLCLIIPDLNPLPMVHCTDLGSQVQLCRHQQLPTRAEDVQMGCLCAGEGTPGRRRKDLFCVETLSKSGKQIYVQYKVLLNVCDFLVGYPHEMKLEVHCW